MWTEYHRQNITDNLTNKSINMDGISQVQYHRQISQIMYKNNKITKSINMDGISQANHHRQV